MPHTTVLHRSWLLRYAALGTLVCLVGIITPVRPQSTECVEPPSGVVAWWQAENDATAAVGINSGSLVGGAGFASGAVGQSFSFDGTGEVAVPHDASMNLQSLTIEAWVYPTVTDGGIDIIVNKEVDSVSSLLEYEIGIRGTDFPGRGTIPVGNLAFFLGEIGGLPNEHDGWADAGGSVPLNRWTHVALTFDGNTVVAYIDGLVTRTLSNLSGSLSTTTGALKIGSRSDVAIARNPRERFGGLIDELTIYNRALSLTEIQDIFEADASGKCSQGGGDPPCPTQFTDIVSWWPGEDDALDIVNSNHGVALNGTSFTPGLVDRSFSFDGADDYVNIPQADSIFFTNSEPFTVEAWFKAESETPSYFILKNAAYGVRWQGSSSSMWFYNGNNHSSTKTTWELGRWYHVALVDDGVNSVKLYVDGVLDRSDDGVLRNPNRFPCHSSGAYCFPLQFGGVWETHDVEYFQGQVDEVTLYSRALTADEIEDIFLLGSRGKCGEGDNDGDGFPHPDDCDDQDDRIYPGAPETYDAQDNDCDGLVDEGLDDDGDGVPNFYDVCPDIAAGVGVGPDGCPVCAVDPDGDGDGFPVSIDCDDRNEHVYPGATETCNTIDDDCDLLVDEGFDQDNDGFVVCAEPVPDCNDNDPATNPAAQELPGNSVDENCDGSLGACDPVAAWRNHGEFVRCVTTECQQLVAAGVLTDAECDVLVSQAGQSNVGK